MIKIVFFGTPAIAVKSLEYLVQSEKFEVLAVVTQQDKPSGRGHKVCASPVKQAALRLGIPVFQPKSIRKDAELMQKLRDLAPDFFVTFAFGQILSQEVLDIPKYYTVNLHASLLPSYRGANPIQRCIYNGDCVTGITTMLTVLDLDAGDICLSEKIDIDAEMTDVVLAEIISNKSPKLIEKTLCGLVNGEIQPQKQDETKVTFANKFNKSDGKIDFTKSAKEIVCQVRAMYSWPNAYTTYKGKHIKIMKACSVSYEGCEENGKVISVTKEGIEVCAGKDKLVLQLIKPEGKGIMSAYSWSNGSGIVKGDKFGE